jgi:hypothetical protein
MKRPVKSYAELQRQHISAELRQRETVTRKAAETAWRTASDDIATTRSMAEVGALRP